MMGWEGGRGTGEAELGKVAQPAPNQDKRLRRAFGILDTARWPGFVMVKGCCQPLSDRVDPTKFGWAASILMATELYCDYCFVL